MKRKWLYFILLIIVLLAILIGLIFFNKSNNSLQQQEGFKAHRMIAHAMGGISGKSYTNSYEAFIANYEKGIRVFESDFLLSADDDLIARHEWGESFTKLMGQEDGLKPERYGAIFTTKEFKDAKIMGRYEPLTWDDVLDLMVDYPDMYLVTDTKQIKPEEIDQIFSKIVDGAKKRDPEILTRIVPQIYNHPMWDQIEAIYPFESVIFTLYQTHESDDEVLQFAEEKGLAAITMSEARANKNLVSKLNKLGIPSYVHTINDVETMQKFKNMGVYGFYTDFLTEADGNRSWWSNYLGL
ncbi:phosphatidylinositol-specific phospholipase C/glycerophosphodiester phosphodiesterase family protein [Paenibacillus sp. D2_2]|uniref:phosphatidylinositol-specific phospholipase C/glycerophosphodiester phosphodiesterase family protein n=1 Tax=Paenibacillus sp. D2_2 TaxID=3073092 RepID=UPI002814C542|nr:phosphatidylinositol-specific phospholipase C/glycerophosphodiester phosphodiesterase family protein [Paenibacillus sp. D2_2]WMT40580.1 phosphatidylinositol-specific phospholipase C/glycerophosphodiester phosphodiesterase family protein [Paenibacillus sp. D2_2]